MVQQTTYSKDDAKSYAGSRSAVPARLRVTLHKAGRMGRALRLAAILIAAAMALFGFGFFLFWSLIDHETGQQVARADGIVALTGGTARIPEAVKLLAQGKGRRLLISGVNPTTTRKELASLVPGNQHLFRCCVDVGHEARDTIGNADETSQWVRERKFKSLIVVTSSYHMPRSLAELRRTLPNVQLIAYPVQAGNGNGNGGRTHPGTLRFLLTEYVKFMPAFLRCAVAQIWRGEGLGGSARQCLNGASTL